jgi:transcriptional regulator with PAS, ATPase and Fis domain
MPKMTTECQKCHKRNGYMNTAVAQTMIEALEKPAIFIDTNYKILAVNSLYKDCYDGEVVLGKSRCFEISHGHKSSCDKHGEACPIQECKSTGRSSSVVHIHNTKKGKTYCDIIMKPVIDADGITTGFLEILERVDFASADPNTSKIIGSSLPFKKMLSNINSAAKADIAVLLQGETGTGKELVAKALHDSSKRAKKPYVVIECTGLNENLFESELFGHEKGAFTGATSSKTGLIEVARGGTVFFDEIADVPLSMQVKLLRLLETQCYRTVGGLKLVKADFRLICATHKDLLDLVEKGLFRIDLYYRIAGFPIKLPSLCERKEDIPDLAKHFLKRSEMNHKRFSVEALNVLKNQNFAGNIRELKNIVEQSALLAPEDKIETNDLPERIGLHKERVTPVKGIVTLEAMEKHYLSQLCEEQRIPIEDLASALDVSTRTLYRKFQKFGLKYE